MKTYNINRSFFHNSQIHHKGESIELSERQARYLLISGTIEMTDAGLRDVAPAEPSPEPKEKPSQKPNAKRAPVKKKAVKKHRASGQSE